jgi:hypothetical protein
MAYFFGRGRPRVGAVRGPAFVAGVMALRVPGEAPAAGISVVLDQPRLPRFGHPVFADAVMRAGGLASVLASVTACGRGRAQCDHGRFSV